jgi:excisionase family DNA binding protein
VAKIVKTLADDTKTLADNLFAARHTFLCPRVVATPICFIIKKTIYMTNELIEKRLEQIEKLLPGRKDVFTFEGCCRYTGISRTYMYKLTGTNRIPHFKQHGKIIYFSKAEIDAWLMKNPVKTTEAIDREATAYLMSGQHKRK